MDRRELLVYPVEFARNSGNLKQNTQNPNVHLVPQMHMPGAVRTPKVCLGRQDICGGFSIKSPPTPTNMGGFCNYNREDVDGNDQQDEPGYVYCKPFAFCGGKNIETNQNIENQNIDPNVMQNSNVKPDNDITNNPQFEVTPAHSVRSVQANRQQSDISFRSAPLTPHSVDQQQYNNVQQLANFQHNTALQQYVAQQESLTRKFSHNLSKPEEHSLKKAIEIISCLADALERDSKETALFPNNVCIKLEHHAIRARNALKEIQGVLGEREPPGCNLLCYPLGKYKTNEAEEDNKREMNNKAIAESVQKLETQIAQLRELLGN